MTTGSKKSLSDGTFSSLPQHDWGNKAPALIGLKGLKHSMPQIILKHKTFPNKSFCQLLNAKIVALRKPTREESRLLVVHWFRTI